jgi:hypothetical protein
LQSVSLRCFASAPVIGSPASGVFIRVICAIRGECTVSLSISRRPKQCRRDEPELVAEWHDLLTQVKHHARAELPAEFVPQRFERRAQADGVMCEFLTRLASVCL